jgi:hypothetical protein
MDGIAVDLIKAVAGPLAAVGLAWLVGNRISAEWVLRQKRREQSISTAAEFYRLYGEFFALWKMCNYAFRDAKTEVEQSTVWSLMARATALEASGEAILLRIASEVVLTPADVRSLGLFRQGLQRLRLSIQKQKILGWISSQHPEYLAFKRLSATVAKLAASVGMGRSPSADAARAQLEEVTHNKWSKAWPDGDGTTPDAAADDAD